MTQRSVDIAIIGAGTAGMCAYRAARQHSNSVVLIEGGHYGTTCARVGCMPSKLLIAAADTAHQARHTAPFGIHLDGEVHVDGRGVLERVRRERDRFVDGVLKSVEDIPEQDRMRGHARFDSPHTLVIDDETHVDARRVVIATGSRPTYPRSFEAAGDRLITSDDVFEWPDLPESVAVFGPGIIGLELAQALARLGVRLRLFGIGGAIGPLSDARVRDYADGVFNQELYLDPDATTESIERHGDSVAITFIDRPSGERVTEHFDYLLAATGRRPNLDNIALDKAGLALDDKGTPLFDTHSLQCRNDDGTPGHVFIAGDADNDMPLLHEASDEGRIAGDNAGRFPDIRSTPRRAPVSVVFSHPQIAIVGPGHAELEKRYGARLAIGEVSFEDQGRARVMRINKGLMRVYAEHGSGKLLGAEVFAPQAEHLAHLLSWSLQQALSIPQMLCLPFYHPTLEEGLRTALRDVNSKLHFGAAMQARDMEYGPGN